MELGLFVGYSGATVNFPIQLVQLAERLGYESVWTAEAYGSDAITPLAWIAAQTSRIKLGTAIMQCDGILPARFVPREMPRFRTHIEEGFRRAGSGKSWDGFSFEALTSVVLTDDVSAGLRAMKRDIALYVGGMGHPTVNFHKRAME